MLTANGTKSRGPGGHTTNVTMGSEMQSAHGHSKSMANAHGGGVQGQNLGKLDGGN